ncbi:MAG TPA: hypothetical protein VLG27_00340 [Candidatus Saccharimonadia bacterium]|nr:hypothetical protein [Candidatus Saccharimonadia bacterium]
MGRLTETRPTLVKTLGSEVSDLTKHRIEAAGLFAQQRAGIVALSEHDVLDRKVPEFISHFSAEIAPHGGRLEDYDNLSVWKMGDLAVVPAVETVTLQADKTLASLQLLTGLPQKIQLHLEANGFPRELTAPLLRHETLD